LLEARGALLEVAVNAGHFSFSSYLPFSLVQALLAVGSLSKEGLLLDLRGCWVF